MKRVLLFLFVSTSLFCGNLLSIDKKNIAIGCCGIAILYLNARDLKWNLKNLQKYKTKKNSVQNDLDEMGTLSNNCADKNRNIVRNVYEKHFSFVKPFDEYFKKFSFEVVRDQNGNFVRDLEPIHKTILEKNNIYGKNIASFQRYCKYNAFYGFGGFTLLVFGCANHKYRWM